MYYSHIVSWALALGLTFASEDDNELICHTPVKEECYPKIFVPTNEFQDVHEDQSVPKGLHIRLNLETGRREAKINNPDDGQTANAIQVLEPGDAVSVSTSTDADLIAHDNLQQRPLQDDDHGKIRAPLPGGPEEDRLTSAIATIRAAKLGDKEDLIQALASLEETAHDIHWGLTLVKDTNLVRKLLALLAEATHDKVQGLAALSLGTCIQNNKAALSTLLHSSLEKDQQPLKVTLDTLPKIASPRISAQLVYLLSELCQDAAQLQKFQQRKGLDLLRDIFDSDTGDTLGQERLRQKIANFLLDHLLSSKLSSKQREAKINDAAEKTRSQWCSTFDECIEFVST